VTLLLKNLLFTFVVPGTVAVYVPLLLARDATAAPGPTRGLAVLLFALGGSIYAWCVWDFATFGRGTPHPIDAPKRLLVRGLYRWVRNPMYLGVLTTILAWAVLFRSARVALYAGAIATGFHLFVVLYEERRLAQLFGDEYAAYRARVGRWLPRPPAVRASSGARPRP
jgi:protein-S-isoprenylcysteine O-methyltransferase Ste14